MEGWDQRPSNVGFEEIDGMRPFTTKQSRAVEIQLGKWNGRGELF